MSENPPNSRGRVAAVTLRVPAQAEALAGLRTMVRDYIGAAGGDRAAVDDLELVTSELATNVIDHTAATTITVTIERTADAWILQVDDVAHPFVPSDVVVLPATSQPAGRGLFVVQALVDELEVVETSASRTLRCRRRLSA